MSGWIIGIAVIGVIIIVVLILHYYVYKHYHYVCSKCSTSFTPSFWRSVFALNGGDTRMMKCPTCNCVQSVKAVKNE